MMDLQSIIAALTMQQQGGQLQSPYLAMPRGQQPGFGRGRADFSNGSLLPAPQAPGPRIPPQLTPQFVGLLNHIRTRKEATMNPEFARGLSGSKGR